MDINAIARLKYFNGGESISNGWERLSLIVKFKVKGKIFKVKLVETLADTYYVENSWEVYEGSYENYYDDVEKHIEDRDKLKEVATNMVMNYFKKYKKNILLETRNKEINKKVSNSNKIEVKVTIK